MMRKPLIAAALILLVACGQHVASSPAVAVPQPKPFQPPASWGVFVTDRQAMDGNWQLTEFDAGNLKDKQLGFRGMGTRWRRRTAPRSPNSITLPTGR